jgi:uncharacterized protein YcfJ
MSTVPVTQMPQGPTMSPTQFAAKIKAAYPAYSSIPDEELTQKVIDKHPVYKQVVYQPSQGGVTPTPSKAGKMFDTVAQSAVNAAPGIAGTVGAVAGGAIAGPIGASAGGAFGSAVGEAGRERAEGEKPSGEKQVKSALLGGLAGPAEELGAAIPLKSRAGKLLASVSEKAGNVPVDLDRSAEHLLRTKELADAGGSMPMSINKMLRRVTDPSKGPLTYSEARDFYSNITRLSADEMDRLTPVMKAQVGKVAAALKDDIGQAAAKVNKAADYYAGIREYAKAAQLQRAGERISKQLLKMAAVAAGAEGAYQLGKAAVKK